MPTSIHLAELKRLLDEGVQLVDALPPEDYEQVHLPGARNIPLKGLDADSAAVLDGGRPVAVYCHDAL